MMDPRRITMKRGAFSGQMILVGVGESYVYANGQRTDEVSAIRCDVVLPAYGYEHLYVKLPLDATVDPGLVGKAVDFAGFTARVYSIDGRLGYAAAADAVTIAKA
ncbi:MAG: hypothetical protein LUH36_01290 [Oscillospiraceae bacterium]|nr:hypothetical protein [Oscillospiraceae bacterium]